MCGRLWRVLHPLLTLFAVGCCAWFLWRDTNHLPTPPSAVPSAVAPVTFQDSSLRSLFGVGRFGGEFTVPSGDTVLVLKMLRFEDGVYLPQNSSSTTPIDPAGSRVLPIYASWGRRSDGTMGVAIECCGGTQTMTDEFFAKISGAMISSSGPAEDLRGYRVVGYVTTSRRRGGEDAHSFSGAPLAQLIQTQHCVVALGVKTFPTWEAAQAWTNRRDE